MKSTSNVCLLSTGAINHNSKLKLGRQNSNQKGSMHLAPIIKITPSKTINHNSNQKRLKIVSVSKKQQLKISNQENTIPSSQNTSFQIHQVTIIDGQNRSNKIQNNLKSRSNSQNKEQVYEFEKIVPSKKIIQEDNELEQFTSHPSEQTMKQNTFQSNESICIRNDIFHQNMVKIGIQQKQKKFLHMNNEYIFERQMNQNGFTENNQFINQKTTNCSNLYLNAQTMFGKDSKRSIFNNRVKQLSVDSNVIRHTLFIQNGEVDSSLKQMNTLNKNSNYQLIYNQQLIYLNTIKRTLFEQTKLLEESKKIEFNLKVEITKKQQQLQQLQFKLNHRKDQLLSLSQQYESIINYSRTQEKNKILMMVSKDYLELQAEIYDYAAYLQSNQLANDINFEPRPFSEIQKLILQREKDLKDSLFGNQKEIVDKSALMSQFISETMRLFKKKDEEMQKLSNFRAKCILKFVSKMKSWLSNWQLKQEYLRNLKMEFMATLLLLRSQVFTLEEKLCEKELSLQKMNRIANINEMIDKIELNFKLGNSFY